MRCGRWWVRQNSRPRACSAGCGLAECLQCALAGLAAWKQPIAFVLAVGVTLFARCQANLFQAYVNKKIDVPWAYPFSSVRFPLLLRSL